VALIECWIRGTSGCTTFLLLFVFYLKSDLFLFLQVNGRLETNGLDITFSIDDDSQHGINITGGPLSYVYTITDIKFHYGKNGNTGSEHKIGNKAFPAEVWGICFFSRVFPLLSTCFNLK